MDIKALRQKILDLAIRGKLDPQNPDDEPEEKLKAKDIKNDTVIFRGEDNANYIRKNTLICIGIEKFLIFLY